MGRSLRRPPTLAQIRMVQMTTLYGAYESDVPIT